MLYHPCAHPFMVNRLRKLVTNCIRKHVITRDTTRLTPERPLALVTWGCRMVMNRVENAKVVSFIKVRLPLEMGKLITLPCLSR